MTQLAIVAALLMLIAPLVSRALLAVPASVPEPAAAQHAMHGEMRGMAHHASHGMSHGGEHAHHAVSQDGADATVAPPSASVADPHAAHGEACDYCVLAARLLPWLAVCLVLLPLRWRLPVLSFTRAPRLPRQRWPAHAARGPPALLLVR